MPAQQYGTERRNTCTVNVESGSWGQLGNLGPWDKRSGGSGGSEETKISPAGMGEIAIGGRPTAENVTVSRFFKIDREPAVYAALLEARGKAEMGVTMEVLDQHENPTGFALHWSGVLMDVTPHDQDSTSNTGSELTLVMSASSPIVVTL